MENLLRVLFFISGDLLHTQDQVRDIRKTGFREYGLPALTPEDGAFSETLTLVMKNVN